MNNKLLLILLLTTLTVRISGEETDSWIRINQLGYLPESVKVAVYLSENDSCSSPFSVRSAQNNRIVFSGDGIQFGGKRWGMKKAMRLNFSAVLDTGRYYIECNGVKSPVFRINDKVYNGTADFLLRYMRQQRCGFNPYMDTICHGNDGYIVDHPTRDGEKVDVRGGWHDASDYLQYLPTSANATFQMLFAWQQTPDKTIFQDEYDSNGKPGANGIPDILDEARWGLEWMARMNPDSTLMFNQIADDRDHASLRIPTTDKVDYGYGPGMGRPVYPVTGKPQGLRQYVNRSTGVASSAAKFASAFALGSDVFKNIDPDFSCLLKEKAGPAYRYGKRFPGNNQTACTISPYFYEEDNWVDDMELAASVAYHLSNDEKWRNEADYWGQLEEITPWMELGRGRHYQYYPFVNLGHYYLSKSDDPTVRTKYQLYMKKGLECLAKRAAENDDPFLFGIPFLWCSNNLVAAALTQARLYQQSSGDDSYLEMEAALRDWLFGCNPWGTSMICGLPADGDSPIRPHSFVCEVMNDIPYGGLVDGPIERIRFETLLGIHLKYEDMYAPFQKGAAVYHDDPGDYSSNEPTMDGTASLSYYLSTMEKMGKYKATRVTDNQGAIVRYQTPKKIIYLMFSADEAFEGAPVILKTLSKHRAKASFFLTGNCLRNSKHKAVIKKIIRNGHYVGGHSDNHLLYASWDNRDSMLVTPDSLSSDLNRNIAELERFGIQMDYGDLFLPPYEWYNRQSVDVINRFGLITVNFTPGILTAADYTTPDMKNYKSSQCLIEQLFEYEKQNTLNGAIILIHPGTHPSRTDKLYNRLDEIMTVLIDKGYQFEKLPSGT